MALSARKPFSDGNGVLSESGLMAEGVVPALLGASCRKHTAPPPANPALLSALARAPAAVTRLK